MQGLLKPRPSPLILAAAAERAAHLPQLAVRGRGNLLLCGGRRGVRGRSRRCCVCGRRRSRRRIGFGLLTLLRLQPHMALLGAHTAGALDPLHWALLLCMMPA